jgi:hypothetical protein
VAPPEDPELRRTIEAMAPFVARNGPAFEAVAVKENAKKHTFSFLTGGAGAEYYRWRVQVRAGGLVWHAMDMPADTCALVAAARPEHPSCESHCLVRSAQL